MNQEQDIGQVVQHLLKDWPRPLPKNIFSNADINYLVGKYGLHPKVVGRMLRAFGEGVVLESLRCFSGEWHRDTFVRLCRRVAEGKGADMSAQPWPSYPDCPCGCGAQGMKLQLRHDRHLVGCTCRSCTGRRNRKAGQRTQARTHRRLGGQGWTPTNEEAARPYTVEVSIMPETKGGQQVPASFDKFIGTEWFRRALSQSARAVPAGSGVLPSISIRGDFVVVDIRGKTL